jgi:ribosomal protein S18 acetylase RimI-like enzyme
VGCAGLRWKPGYGEIKRMWVAPRARGLGIGRRLLEQVEELTERRGLPAIRLDTNKALAEAQALYRKHGYREIAPYSNEPYAHFWFEKVLGGG